MEMNETMISKRAGREKVQLKRASTKSTDPVAEP